jgi:hypothetical protein
MADTLLHLLRLGEGRYVEVSQILRQPKSTLHLAQQFICGLLQFDKAEPLLSKIFD